MTPEYLSVAGALTARYDRVTKEHLTAVQGQAEMTNKEREIITHATAEFLTSGVANLNQPYINLPHHGAEFGHRTWDWVQYFRKIAEEANRPFIRRQAGYRDWRGGNDFQPQSNIVLRIPRKRKLAPLVSSLLIANETGQLSTTHNTVDYCFTFRAHLGEIDTLYKPWLKMIRTQPECREVLNLGSYPNG